VAGAAEERPGRLDGERGGDTGEDAGEDAGEQDRDGGGRGDDEPRAVVAGEGTEAGEVDDAEGGGDDEAGDGGPGHGADDRAQPQQRCGQVTAVTTPTSWARLPRAAGRAVRLALEETGKPAYDAAARLMTPGHDA
jgi:hypothetical protein